MVIKNGNQFINDFENLYGYLPSNISGNHFDAVNLGIYALNSLTTSDRNIRERANHTSNYTTSPNL